MLHHCNIDRLIAMWQAINYNNSMFTSTYQSPGQFATAAGTQISAQSELKPFYSTDRAFHTSNSVRETRALGYAYPEIRDWELNGEALSADVTRKVNSLYRNGGARRRDGENGEEHAPSREYFVEVQLELSELELPCSVNLYVGEERAGSVNLLAMPAQGPSHSEIPLRTCLEASYHGNAEPEKVVAYLKENARVEIRKVRRTSFFLF